MATIIWLLVWWSQGNPDFINPELTTSWFVWFVLCFLFDVGSSRAID